MFQHPYPRRHHVPAVTYDEVDEARLSALQASLNIQSSRVHEGTRLRGRSHYISTKNHPGGIVSQLVAGAGKEGMRSMAWSYLEVTERCPDWRSGTSPAMIYVRKGALVWELNKPARAESKHDPWVRTEVLDGCLRCPIVTSCRARLKKANGPRPIQDLIDKWRNPLMTAQTWRSQLENIDPSREGLAIPNYLASLTRREEWDYDPLLPVYWSVDFGDNHLTVVLAGQEIPLGHRMMKSEGTRERHGNRIHGRKHIFQEYTARESFQPGVTDWIGENWIVDRESPRYRYPSKTFIDPSGYPAFRSVTIKGRRVVFTKANNKRAAGFNLLRGYCDPVQDHDHSKLTFHTRCEQLHHEMKTCKRQEIRPGVFGDVEKIDDDALDDARYFVMSLDHPLPVDADEYKRADRKLWEGVGGV